MLSAVLRNHIWGRYIYVTPFVVVGSASVSKKATAHVIARPKGTWQLGEEKKITKQKINYVQFWRVTQKNIVTFNLLHILEICGVQEQIFYEDTAESKKEKIKHVSTVQWSIHKQWELEFNKLTREKTITTKICTAPISRHVPTSGKP